ncbi:MAG: T9SS type A sorting domain-containing protein [Bacteroidota bacterium]
MKRTATLLTLGLLVAAPAFAQLDRTSGDDADVIWARDIGSASIAVDGALDEPEWAQAESIQFQWDTNLGFPGSGQFFQGGQNPNAFEDPVDPIDATVSFLRKGNELYVGVQANDKSIGGQPGLWNFDGIWMTLIDRNDRPDDFSTFDDYFAITREEFAFSWWTRGNGIDTTATGEPLPEIPPLFYIQVNGNHEAYADPDSTAIDFGGVEFAYSIDGIANDDFNGGSTATDDTGYTMEFMIAVDSLGWDLTQERSRMPLTIAMQDADYNWPTDASQYSTHRVFWQGQWLNTMTGGDAGAAYIAGDPGVTVSSGEAPAYDEPEFTVPLGFGAAADPTIDGVLDEELWGALEPQFTFKYQATPDELDAGLPGVLSPYYSLYFHPDDQTVLDPTEGRIRMFYRGSRLFLGLDTDDQAVNGIDGEGGRDGFRLLIRSRDSTNSNLQAESLRFDFSVDSTGAIRYNTLPEEVEEGVDIVGAVSLKGASTAADPSDIDTGYQMEVALDLASIGYSADAGGESIWVALNYFDGDALQEDAQSYATRTWSLGERSNGASIMGYLDPDALLVTSTDTAPEADALRDLGSFPNPTAGTATIRYELPRATVVTVEVFDVLGRLVQTVEMGDQAAGRQAATIDASALSAGAYVYRVATRDGASVSGRMLVTR